MNRLDRRTLDELTRLYTDAVGALKQDILAYADRDATIRLEVLQDLLRQANAQLDRLQQARDTLLGDGLNAAAQLGVAPYLGSTSAVGVSLAGLANDAVRFVQSFVAADGLQLSDRLWRIDRHAREVVSQAIERAVILGHSASRATADFLARGQTPPPDLVDKIGQANADRIARAAGSAIMTGAGSPYDNAMRLFRTELNRAHGEAYQAAAFAHPDVAGTRFLLSPRHPEPDICDMHASVNLYGLGRGVYPEGKNPWPAHPNTLSYVEVVFSDEITESDRQGKQTALDWLRAQSTQSQISVLGSRKKAAALQRDLLPADAIATPWNAVKARLERAGVDTDSLTLSPIAELPTGSGRESGRSPAEVRTDALRYVLDEGHRTGYEYLVAYDVSSGNTFIQKTSRLPGAVNFSRHELTLLNDARNRIDVVHNHPSSSSLSLADLGIGTLPGVERVTAYGHEGTLYSAKSLGTRDDIVAAARQIDAMLRTHIQPLVDRGILSPSQAGVLHQHVLNLALDRRRLIEYSLERLEGTLKGTLTVVGDRWLRDVLDNL